MNYKIIKAMHPDHLEILVRDYLNLGWMPVGGIVADHHQQVYYQTLVTVDEGYVEQIDCDADTEDYS